MRIFMILVVVAGLLGVAGWMFTRGGPTATRTWKMEKVELGALLIKVTASGTIEPVSTIQVGSQVSGKVKEVSVEPDESVKKDQVLAVLDTELLEADLRDKEFLLEKIRTGLDLLAIERRNLDLKGTRLKLSRERSLISVERSKANHELAVKNLERYRDLLKVGDGTQTVLEIKTLEEQNARRDVALQGIALKSLDLDLKQLATDLDAIKARERNAQNDVAQAEQALAKTKTNLRYASIRSPIEGVVLERSVEPGQTIAAQFQAPNLFKIASSLNRIRVLVQIDEAEVGRIKPGQETEFEVDAYRGERFEGNVVSVRLKHEMRSNLVTYPVVIEAPNEVSETFPQGKLRPGMTAYVTFKVDRKENVVKLPASALRFAPPPGVLALPAEQKFNSSPESEKDRDKDKPGEKDKKEVKKPDGMTATLYVKNAEGQLESLIVRVGESDGAFYELLSSELKPGDEVVTAEESSEKGGKSGKDKGKERRIRIR